MKTEFKNEFGNNITLEIIKYDDKNIWVKMVGPKSISTNLITMMEAKFLYQMLGQMFGEASAVQG